MRLQQGGFMSAAGGSVWVGRLIWQSMSACLLPGHRLNY